MDLNQIRSFLAVTQTLNFTNAAKQNGVPQSTVSRQIGDLESQLGVKLFYRTKRDVQLTEEGRTFLPYAQEMVEAAKKGAFAVRQLREGAKGRLSVAAVPTADRFLADCLREFGRAYPNIVVDITHVSGGDALMDQGQDPYDFHFLHQDMCPDSEEFDTLTTHAVPLCLVAPKGEPLDTGDLKDLRFILISENESPILYMEIMDLFRSQRFSPNVVNESDDLRAVLLSVQAGLGVTILPVSNPQELEAAGLACYPLEIDVSYAVAWKKSLLNPAAELFLDIVRGYCG
jgi:DNA-binding transcriptional LysR family regulator